MLLYQKRSITISVGLLICNRPIRYLGADLPFKTNYPNLPFITIS